jgi:hypothetical protein
MRGLVAVAAHVGLAGQKVAATVIAIARHGAVKPAAAVNTTLASWAHMRTPGESDGALCSRAELAQAPVGELGADCGLATVCGLCH